MADLQIPKPELVKQNAPPRPTARAVKILEGDPVDNLVQHSLILYNIQIGRVFWHGNVPFRGKRFRNGNDRMHKNPCGICEIARAHAVGVAGGRTRADDPDDPG